MARPLSSWRRARRLLTYVAIRALMGVLRLLPRAAGALCGLAAYALAPGERRRAREQLARAFPELGERAVSRTIRRCFAHLGRSAAEVAQIDRIRRRFDREVLFADEDRRVLEDALALGRGVVVVTGHVGNWELLGFYLAWCGYPVRTLARGLADPRLNAFVRAYRESRGVRTILRGEDGASRAMLRAFREGAVLGFFLDQDTDVPGVFVPFFGRPAWTPSGAAVLALRTGAAAVVATIARLADGRHRLTVAPYEVVGTGDIAADVERITTDLTALLESAVRRSPEQWVWMHRRWRRQPGVRDAEHAEMQ